MNKAPMLPQHSSPRLPHAAIWTGRLQVTGNSLHLGANIAAFPAAAKAITLATNSSIVMPA
jgi:hypothetical protein